MFDVTDYLLFDYVFNLTCLCVNLCVSFYLLFLFTPPPSLNSEIRWYAWLLWELLGFGVLKKWYFQSERGSNPKHRASEEDALCTPPTPPGREFLSNRREKQIDKQIVDFLTHVSTDGVRVWW